MLMSQKGEFLFFGHLVYCSSGARETSSPGKAIPWIISLRSSAKRSALVQSQSLCGQGGNRPGFQPPHTAVKCHFNLSVGLDRLAALLTRLSRSRMLHSSFRLGLVLDTFQAHPGNLSAQRSELISEQELAWSQISLCWSTSRTARGGGHGARNTLKIKK